MQRVGARTHRYLGVSPGFNKPPCIWRRTFAVSRGSVVASAIHAAMALHAKLGASGRAGPLAGGDIEAAGSTRDVRGCRALLQRDLSKHYSDTVAHVALHVAPSVPVAMTDSELDSLLDGACRV